MTTHDTKQPYARPELNKQRKIQDVTEQQRVVFLTPGTPVPVED